MTMVQNRRNFLTTLSLAGAAGLAGFPRTAAAAEPPPETTTIRLPDSPITCAGPLYMAEELLHEEGFAEVRYVPATVMTADLLASGEIDFDLEDGFDYLPLMDAGKPCTILAGIHLGCLELRGNDSIQRVTDLRGKKVAIGNIGGADHLFVSAVAAYVGLDPAVDITWIANPPGGHVELFTAGKIDAFTGVLNDRQQPCMHHAGHVVVNMANDPPWSNYFCCMATANTDFVRKNPVATKRALRAILKATDICHKEPERVARRMADRGFSYECALMMLNHARYGLWRDYDPEDAVRYFTLRLHEAGLVKVTPNEIVSGFTDWRFLGELKRELKI
jgi:NitT/TauT family transport system substrate-binding protein